MLADEPTGNLDSDTARQVMGLILDHVQRHGATLVLVTHDEELPGPCTDRVLRLKDGRLTRLRMTTDGRALRAPDRPADPAPRRVGQQKMRTILTTLGVVFGAFVLAASLSIGEGVQQTIDRESRRIDISRRVEVYPKRTSRPRPGRQGKREGQRQDDRANGRNGLRKSLAEQKPQPARGRSGRS